MTILIIFLRFVLNMEGYLTNAEAAINAGKLDEAEVFVNRASLLLNDLKENVTLTTKYKVLFFIN